MGRIQGYTNLIDIRPEHQTYTENNSTFFLPLELTATAGRLTWSNVENPASNNPDVDVQMSRIANSDIPEHAGHVAIDLMDITWPHRPQSPRCPTAVGP